MISTGALVVDAAAATWINSGTTDWNTAGNWNPSGVPNGSDAIVNTNTGSIATITGNVPNPNDVIVGNGSGTNGRVDHTAGTITTGSWFKVGHNGGTGVYNLANTAGTGGTLTGFGQGSGSVVVGTNGEFRLGGDGGTTTGTGTFNMNTTGSLSVTNGNIRIGESGNGVLNLDSGTINKTGGGNIIVGGTSGRTGVVNMSGGTINNAGELQLGNNSSTGTVTMSGGAINTASWVGIGHSSSGSGTLNVSGGTLTKTGSGTNFIIGDGASAIGTVTLSGTGVIDIQAGDLQLTNATGASATLNLNGGTLKTTTLYRNSSGTATVNFNGGTIQAKANNATNFISNLNTANIQAGGAIIDTQTFAVDTSQVFTGVGGLTVTGSTGTLTLSGANTFNGNVSVNAATLKLGANDVLANGSGKGDVSVTGTLDVNGKTETINGLSGAGSVFLRTGGQLTVGDNNATSNFSGRLAGQGSASRVTKIGTGTITLSGTVDNDDTRAQVNAGTLVLGKTSTSGVHSVGSGGNTDYALIITGGTAKLGGSGGDQIYINSAVNMTGGTFDMAGLNEGFDGLSGSAGTITNSTSATTSTLTLGQNNSAGSQSFGGIIQNGNGTVALAKTGTGTQTLSGANTYSGGTTISQGTIAIGNNTAFGSGSVSMSDGTTVANSSGAFTLANGFTLSGSTTGLTFTGNQNTTLSGALSSAAAVKVNKTGASVLTLSADNTGTLAANSIWNVTGGSYNSSTGLYDNVIALNSGRALGNSTGSVLNLNGGTLRFTVNGGTGYASSRTINVLSGGGAIDDGGFAFGEATAGQGTVNPNVVISSGATLILVSSNKLVLSGVISGTGGAVTKFGSGTAVLSGSNSYTGATTVNGGTLVINGNISTSVTTVKTGATLGGSGTTGAVTVQSGGTLAPGNSPGILNTGDVSLESGSTLGIEIAGATLGTQYDQLNVTGTTTLAGLLSLTTSYSPVNGTLFFIVANDSTDAITGTFSNATDTTGTTIYTFGGTQEYLISYVGNHTGSGAGTFTGGNDVVLMAVPEPNIAAMLGGLGALALLRRRR